jgi:hypothetical protein
MLEEGLRAIRGSLDSCGSIESSFMQRRCEQKSDLAFALIPRPIE